jgi:hypothetical protein
MKNIGPLIQPLINSFIECKRSELGEKEIGRKHSRYRELEKRERGRKHSRYRELQ